MKIYNFKKSKFFKFLCFVIIFSFLPFNLFNPSTVKADNVGGHDTWMISSTWDSGGALKTVVNAESNSVGDSQEENLMDEDFYDSDGNKFYLRWDDLYSVKQDTGPFYSKKVENFVRDDDVPDGEIDDNGLIFSFPSYDRHMNDSYMSDMRRATTVSTTLTGSVNSLLETSRGMIGYKNLNVEDNIAASAEIMENWKEIANNSKGTSAQSVFGSKNIKAFFCGGNDIYKGWKKGTPKINETYKYVEIDEDGNLMAYIFDSSDDMHKDTGMPNESDTGFVWAMPKGYLNPGLDNMKVTGDGCGFQKNEEDIWGVKNDNMPNEKKGDTVYITIFMLSDYATAFAQYAGITAEGSESLAKGGSDWIEDKIYTMLFGVYSGLLNLLDLNSIPELIYNGGSRGGNAYEAGMMNSSWWGVVLKYHLIFQIVAWMMIIVAVAKILIQINFSTINPALRMSLMETLQKFVIVGFSLALCIPFIRLLATFNNLIVNIFQTQGRDDAENLTAMGLAGIVILLGYFGITFTLNCIYIMRAIMIALLTASAPLFIVSMAFSGPKQKGLFDTWLKEISANIFMQSIHAFAFAFLFDVMDSSRLVTRLVIYFSLLPIIDSFRGLIFGNAGGFASSQGAKSAQTVGGYLSSVATSTGAIGANAVSGAITKKFGSENLPSINTNKDIGAASGGSGGGSGSGSGGAGSVGSSASIGNLNTAGKALKENAANSSGAKGVAQRAAGHALSGASKLASAYKATGGIMGNAAVQANLGNVGESIKASERAGNGAVDTASTIGEDIGTWNQNRKDKGVERDTKNFDKNADIVTAAESSMDATEKHNYDTYNNAAKNLENAKASGNKSQIKDAKKALNNAKGALTGNALDAVNANKAANKALNKIDKHSAPAAVSRYTDNRGNSVIASKANVFSGEADSHGIRAIDDKYAGSFADANFRGIMGKDGNYELYKKIETNENGKVSISWQGTKGTDDKFDDDTMKSNGSKIVGLQTGNTFKDGGTNTTNINFKDVSREYSSETMKQTNIKNSSKQEDAQNMTNQQLAQLNQQMQNISNK